MTSGEFKETIESLRWCETMGYTAMAQFYRELLDDAERRGKLPPEAFPPEEQEEEER